MTSRAWIGARARASVMAALLAGALVACGSPSARDGTSASSASATGSAGIGAAPPVASSASTPSPFGPFPTAARRNTPPPALATSAAKEGSKAPSFALPAPLTGSTWSLADALTKHERVIIVFYRGAW